LTRRSGSSVG